MIRLGLENSAYFQGMGAVVNETLFAGIISNGRFSLHVLGSGNFGFRCLDILPCIPRSESSRRVIWLAGR